MSHKPLIAITQGDPAGVGPEVCLKALRDKQVLEVCRPLLVGDAKVLKQVGERLDLPCPARQWSVAEAASIGDQPEQHFPALLDCAGLEGPVEPGVPTPLAGRATYRYLEVAVEGTRKGWFDAVTTGPATKTTLKMAGIAEPGHTEILGRLTGSEHTAMMLLSPRLVVGFATCHQSLRSVPDGLTSNRIVHVAELMSSALQRLLGRSPRLAVLALNPHAGEDGLFGEEDEQVIRPAVDACRDRGLDVTGPVPADAAFTPAARERYDGYVAMYHDQGHIPFKMISFQDGVNVTIGLPIVRTSVDHGTAYDIAWTGKADETSMIHAILTAAQMSRLQPAAP